MPPVLTSTSVIKCIHGGTVKPIPSQQVLKVDGNPVLVAADLAAAPIPDCPLKPPLVPCTVTVGPPIGPATMLSIGHQPALLATSTGVTNAGTWLVQSAGQAKLTSN